MNSSFDPLNTYLSRLEAWRKQSSGAEQFSNQLGNIRLVVAILTLAVGWFAFHEGTLPGWLIAIPLAVFIGLLVWHEKIARRQDLAKRAVAYFERGLARLDDKWAGTGNAGARFEDNAHIYSGDLDVFGKGSLFELIDMARTAEGEQRLAEWLLNRAGIDEVLARQAAVRELSQAIDLREDVALLGEDVRAGVHAGPLARWGVAPPVKFLPGARFLSLLLALLNLAAFFAFMAHQVPARTVILLIAATLGYRALLRKAVRTVEEGVDTPARDLEILSKLLARLERERFESPLLVQLRAALDSDGHPASRRIAKLGRWKELLDSADHLFVRVIGPVLLWREQAAMGIEAWRRANGGAVAHWIDAVAEIEALSSLAALAFERPEWTFPELAGGTAIFKAEAMRHPLMNPSRCVPNDVNLGDGARLVIVSGSNMSGKSTLLRAIGLNFVLAWAGGPVAAKRLCVTPLALGASMRIVDSLHDGRSRFYAEILRLRSIVDLTSSGQPVLFLLDELLSGTNSHDRRIGAEAVVRTLVERGGIGFVTTHDLALTTIAAELPGAVNVHFEDHMSNGRIQFDYRMRPGVVERSNALELMRAVGLSV